MSVGYWGLKIVVRCLGDAGVLRWEVGKEGSGSFTKLNTIRMLQMYIVVDVVIILVKDVFINKPFQNAVNVLKC